MQADTTMAKGGYDQHPVSDVEEATSTLLDALDVLRQDQPEETPPRRMRGPRGGRRVRRRRERRLAEQLRRAEDTAAGSSNQPEDDRRDEETPPKKIARVSHHYRQGEWHENGWRRVYWPSYDDSDDSDHDHMDGQPVGHLLRDELSTNYQEALAEARDRPHIQDHVSPRFTHRSCHPTSKNTTPTTRNSTGRLLGHSSSHPSSSTEPLSTS